MNIIETAAHVLLDTIYEVRSDNSGKLYKVCEGVYYHIGTSDDIIMRLEQIRKLRVRCRFHWGDTTTGRDWGDTFDVCGTIGLSTGNIKIPLLIHNSRSYGGGAILTDCIVKIVQTSGKFVLYQHPTYHENNSN